MRIFLLMVMLLAQPVFAEQAANHKGFDIQGALKEGYSKAEIADHLASQSKFDIGAARKQGFSDDEILTHLTKSPDKPLVRALPDLSKVPKWREIATKPEFLALSPEKQAEAKAAYFDYWIAPHAAADGINVEQARAEFLRLVPDMPLRKYEVVAPNGKKYVVTAPEGVSESEVLRYAQHQHQGAQLLSDEEVFGKRQADLNAIAEGKNYGSFEFRVG